MSKDPNLEQDLSNTAEVNMQAEQEKKQDEKPEVVEISLEQRIAELEGKLQEAQQKEQDLVLRSRAEVENIRRRATQDVEKAHKFALEKFVRDLLETIDNLERALETPLAEVGEELNHIRAGVELTLKGLLKTVENYGVKSIGAVGDSFNPELHHAIKQEPADGVASNQILQVLQKGYSLNERVIRPAMVIISQ